MTPGQRLAALAGDQHNPYYLAYALETGARTCAAAFERDGSNVEFILWNMERWRETKERHGAPLGRSAPHLVDEHLETLGARIAHLLPDDIA